MKTDDFVEYFQKNGIEIDQSMDRSNALSSRVVRCANSNPPIIAVGGEIKKELLLNAVLDAIHWHIINFGQTGTVRVVFGSGENLKLILPAIATLMRCYRGKINIQIESDFKPLGLLLPDFSDINKNWLSFFQQRETDKPPQLAVALSNRVGVESFRWYRKVTGGYWSGRVEGLEVCRVGPDFNYGQLNVGKPGKTGNNGKARILFLKIANGREGIFSLSRVGEVSEVIKQIAISRKNGALSRVQGEHHLESRILRGAVSINAEISLEPVITDYPFQFPTLWTQDGSARFLDILMRHKDVPYAVELKVPSQGAGEKYRYSISQAVLYREFIRCARQFHGWFKDKGMDAKKCEAIVAIPKVKIKQKRMLQHHRAVGELFGIKIIELNVL